MDRYSILLGKDPPVLVEPAPSVEQISSRTTTASSPTVTRREDILREALRTARGRQLIATALTEPMRLRLDHSSLARRAFLVDRLTPETMPMYEASGATYAVDETGEGVHQIAAWDGNPSRCIVPMFENSSHQFISLTNLRSPSMVAHVDRAQESAAVFLNARETNALLRLFDTMIDVVTPQEREHNLSRNLIVTRLTPDAIADACASIERNDLRVNSYFMNAVEYAIVRRTMRDQIDMETHRALLATGLMGMLWGANVFVSRFVPTGRVYLIAEPEYVGHMPLRDLVVLSTDNPVNLEVGWAMTENVGLCCSNPLGIACITITR